MAEPKTNYTQGYSQATQQTHASRTVESDAAFLLPHIRPTDHILDVGCGPGTITIGFSALVSQGGSVTGVDISETVLEKARELASLPNPTGTTTGTGSPNIKFQQADMLSPAGLPFPDETFDIVFSSQLFPHLSTAQMKSQALKEMRRVLKRDGILATRDAAHLHFYPLPPLVPEEYDLNVLWAGNMLRPFRTRHLPGGDMPRFFYEAGFAPERVTIGAGTTAYTRETSRRWFANACRSRLDEGEPFLESWLEVGITLGEVERTREALERWAALDGAWYVAVQAEVLGWK